ncbi:unnamed protein product [Cochlearia groenlandica]
MAKVWSYCLFSCFLVMFLSLVSAVTDDSQDKKVYIVYMGSLPSRVEYTPMSHHISILQEVTGKSSIIDRLVRSYKRSFNGFAAKLTESESERVAEMEGVVSIFPNKYLQLQTTSSWDFMGLKEGTNTKRNPTVESDTIIGVIDTGIWPESESFSDNGFGPPPNKWKGVCSGHKNFTCNNKLIGARDYTGEGSRDVEGHGTHTASTAAGNAVVDISFFGLGNGTVRGGVPGARIAVYKVCNAMGCSSQDLLSAFDDAIADGVDVITISIGDKSASMFRYDAIAIGGFHAMAKGVLTVNSAGNSGPRASRVSGVAPWILTVAASTTNRGFFTKVVLGNNMTLAGKSVNAFDMKGNKYPLVYGKSAASSACDPETAELCESACIQKSRVKGKILVCRGTGGFKIAESVGAIAIIYKTPIPDVAFVRSLPASGLVEKDFESLVSYIESTASPQASVLKSGAIFNQTSPVIASFSSRGPNTIAVDILKPDITAPGVEILAAYSPDSEPSQGDKRHVKYSVLSGTSMSCPHVAGVAAYIKSFYPKWSTSMIQSAIMTTAWPVNATGTGIASTEFAYGSGHVDPIAAVNPGLVYELEKADYIAFLCGMNYTSYTIEIISGETVICSEKNNILPRNLNYPSMSAQLSGANSTFTVTFNRTLTNVGTPNSTYKSKVVAGHGSKLNVTVTPSVLSFKTVNEKQSFKVVVTGSGLDLNLPSSASLVWSDGIHNVRSPIVVYIVYMGSLPSKPDYTPMSHHMNILQEVTGESSKENRLMRSYKRSFNGFAAKLTESEREKVAEMEGVVSIFPSMNLQLLTTTSWDFMGLREGKMTKRNQTVESDIIIGFIDNEIWPESESFSDKGFGPPPNKWKGVCSGHQNFTCNNKLIGARDYTGYGPRDFVGHGTHTASTAAGNAVADTSFFGLGNGTVRGGVPGARIAVYKACTATGCSAADLFSAFDDAIADGVDLITISIGPNYATKFEYDPIAMGAFHAMAKGVLTVNAAGNSGPKDSTVTSVAPWILSVAASTTNRGFVTKIALGNNKTLTGKSVNGFNMEGKKYPLVYGKDAASPGCREDAAKLCDWMCIQMSRVEGKILVCGGPGGLKIAESIGAIAIIYKSPKLDAGFVHSLPASGLLEKDFGYLVSYIESTDSPMASVLKSEAIFNQTSPVIASFSSRGPNTIVVDILKPDITAPGVEILAAYSPEGEPSLGDKRHVKYSVLSGTSMSCPYVAGVAAYIKTFHPKWSPSMIQSAIMTTAWPVNATGTGNTSTEFAYGSGHVDPIAALNPGLVYELEKTDYIDFLCGLNYTSYTIEIISGEKVNCSEVVILPRNLNYPSMSAQFAGSNSTFTVTFNRTLTNVGTPNSTYKSKVVAGHGSKLNVTVTPSVLSFKTVNEKQSFKAVVTGSGLDLNLPSSASLVWSDGIHNVRSPIVVYSTDGL